MNKTKSTKSKIIRMPSAADARYNAAEERADNIIGLRIDEARKRAGLSLPAFSELLGRYGVSMSPSGINKWTKGNALPNAYQLLAICHALDLDVGLSYFCSNYAPALNEEGQAKLRAYRDDLIASGRYRPSAGSADIRYIEKPVSDLAVSAGVGEFLGDGTFEMVSFPENTVPDGAEFGIRASGDSMEPVYHDGQIVWVQRCGKLPAGTVGIFVYDGKGYLKLYDEQVPDETHIEDFTDSYGCVHMQPVLISYNQTYPPMIIGAEAEFRTVGRVL